MAVKLPDGLAADEIRILQEFYRKKSSTLTMDEIAAIRHPTGARPGALETLIARGYVHRTDDGKFKIDPKGEALTGVDHLPLPFYERG